MKQLFVLVTLLFSFGALAQAGLNVYDSLKLLKRVQVLEVDGVKITGGYVSNDSMAVFYDAPAYDNEAKFRISGDYTKKNLMVEIVREDTVIIFNLPDGRFSGKVVAQKHAIKRGQTRSLPSGKDLWTEYDIVASAGTAKVIMYSALNGNNPISEIVQVTGPLQFNPCDGCEHGDQIMLKNINVISAKTIGDYYFGDCEGHMLPLFDKLFTPYNMEDPSMGLSVPFTFKGFISMDVTDYFDDVGPMWMGADSGELFIGNTTKLPVSRFLDSLIVRSAQILKTDAHVIWKDVTEKGTFTEYKNDVLTFKYKSVIIKTNLKTAQTVQ